MSELCTYEQADGFSTITMDDGRANVMSIEMLAALNRAFDQAEADKAIVLLCGKEKIFSGGFDLATFQKGKEPLFNMLKAGAETAERMLSFPYPIVIACSGHAIAMGVFILLAGDYRLGAQAEYKIHANEVEIGMTLPRFAVEMCRQRLTPAAYNLTTTLAEPWTPGPAVEAGFLDRLVPREALLVAAREKAASFARLNLGAHTATKSRVREEALGRLRAAIESDIEEWSKTFA